MKFSDPSSGVDREVYVSDELTRDLNEHYTKDCTHPLCEPRKKIIAGGSTQIRNQCTTCGALVGSAQKQSVQTATLPLVNEDLNPTWMQRRARARISILLRHWRIQQERDTAWWQAYNTYLASPEWKEKSRLVLLRANGKCEGCGEQAPIQAHHLNYNSQFDEFLFDLVALCQNCHSRAHPKEDSEIPCCGCRLFDEKYGLEWCGQFDIPARAALSKNGRCGPERKALDPLR